MCASVGDCDSIGDDDRAVAGVAGPRLRQAEVEHLDLAVARELDVRRLQVAVDDALVVGLLERFGDLLGDLERLVDRDRRRARAAP